MCGRVAVRAVIGDESVQSGVQRALVLAVRLSSGLQVVDVHRGRRAVRDDRYSRVVAVDREMFQHVLYTTPHVTPSHAPSSISSHPACPVLRRT